MSECCDEFGTCTQGRDCPARTGTVLPHQAAHAARVARIKSTTRPGWMDGKATPRTCDTLGVCQGRGDCECNHPAPPEAGAFKIVDLGPDDDGELLSHDEAMALVRTLLVWLVCVIGLVAGVSMAVGFGTERFADLAWLFLAGVA